ncbi:arginine-tRNA-protein transferase [Podospora appendiculata]|uniref:arginyltransferase n=1 Tax=Podospora appendiculata TaxID=314037 RepID=A0AAE1C980_9PEZI|nr:arginine-tRNA-protein transferase [Podospora appendiculata]
MADTDMHTPDDAAPYSFIFPIGYQSSSNCGYCRRTRSRSGQSQKSRKRYSYYASATSLMPAFYKKLLDRCWRRSGTLLYRPNQKGACCPHYTVRLDSTKFKPNKDQRQAVNRFNRYVLGESYLNEAARLFPLSRDQVRKRDNEFDLGARIHEPEVESLKSPPSPAHRFEVTLEPDTFSEEKYAVFENYQRTVHKEPADKISAAGFKRFLCNSPIRRETSAGPDGTERQLGSFHQCYRLDGKLVAIGVLDILPNCVSAVYFLYHESIHSHNPGKLGAMREIALALEGGYQWWYSGYYIHNCAKMKYKVDFSPQYVLDPESYGWDLLDKEALSILDRKPYVSLSRERRETGTNGEDANRVSPEAEKQPDDQAKGSGDADERDIQNQSESESESESEDEPFLLTSDMPGMPSLQEMEELDMDGLLIRSDFSDGYFLASDLVVWETESISKHGNLKSKIAELVAAIGPELMGEICVDFCRRK